MIVFSDYCINDLVQSLNINDDDELELVQFAQYSDDLSYNIIFIKEAFYFVDTNGTFLCSFDLPEFLGNHISLVTFKCEKINNILSCYYFVGIINSDNKIEVHEYKAILSKEKYENVLIASNIYTPINSLKETTNSSSKYLSCEIMTYCDYILSCFYENESPKELAVINFNINNNLSIYNLRPSVFLTNNGAQIIDSEISINKTKAFVCYIDDNNVCHCVFYNIQTNNWENDKVYFEQCQVRRSIFQNKFYKETKEFLLSCFPTLVEYKVKRFDKNFNLINFNLNEYCAININETYIKCPVIGIPSIVYIPTEKDYQIMSTCGDDRDNYNYMISINEFCGTLNFDLSVDDSYDEISTTCIEENEEQIEEEEIEEIEEYQKEEIEFIEEEKLIASLDIIQIKYKNKTDNDSVIYGEINIPKENIVENFDHIIKKLN